jgi:hypothetical protein
MGDLVPGPDAVVGGKYQAACFSPQQALEWASRCGDQFPERQWLASRLREAAAAWDGESGKVVVVVREVLGSSSTDEEVKTALGVVPPWLAPSEDVTGSGVP